jgi:hypothetical protein
MPITIPLSSDGPPKRQLIELAFGEIGSAGYEFGRTPEEVTDALTRLNALMYQWPWNQLGYIQPDYGVGEPDNPSGIKFEAMNAVAAALAARIAPAMGASLSPEAKANLAIAMSSVYALVATVPSMPMDRHTPRGLGSEHRYGIGYSSPFIEETADDLTSDGDSDDIASV